MSPFQAVATALGVTDPRSWGAVGWASDLFPHLAYGLAAATAYSARTYPEGGTGLAVFVALYTVAVTAERRWLVAATAAVTSGQSSAGRLTLERTGSDGSTFRITLPRRDAGGRCERERALGQPRPAEESARAEFAAPADPHHAGPLPQRVDHAERGVHELVRANGILLLLRLPERGLVDLRLHLLALGFVSQHFEKLLLEFDVAIKLGNHVRQARAFVEPVFQVYLFQNPNRTEILELCELQLRGATVDGDLWSNGFHDVVEVVAIDLDVFAIAKGGAIRIVYVSRKVGQDPDDADEVQDVEVPGGVVVEERPLVEASEAVRRQAGGPGVERGRTRLVRSGTGPRRVPGSLHGCGRDCPLRAGADLEPR